MPSATPSVPIEPLRPEKMPAGLLFGVSLGRRQVLAQFLCRPAWTVARRIALNAPSFPQGPGIHGVEPEIVEQFRHNRLGGRIVAGDDERTAVLRSRRLPVRGQLRGIDVVERLDDL